MNIPNLLTMIRIALVPVFLVFLLIDSWQSFPIALAVFVVASLTDFMDGHIARKYDLVTKLGKLIDPLADKILTASAFVALTYLDMISPWIVIAIITREFIISIFRAVAASEGKVIAASVYGKFKTVFQMSTIIAILLSPSFPLLVEWRITDGLAVITLVLTVVSAADYLFKNRDVIKE